MLAALSLAFTTMADDSTVLAPAEQQQVAAALEEDAEVMSNTQLEEQLAGQPPATQAEIIRINTEARPLALQIALLIPILAGLIGLFELVPDDAACTDPKGFRVPRSDGFRLASPTTRLGAHPVSACSGLDHPVRTVSRLGWNCLGS